MTAAGIHMRKDQESEPVGLSAIDSERRRRRATVESVGDAVISVDTAGHITEMNAAAEALTAWRATEARGQPLANVLRIIAGEEGAVVDSPIAHVLRVGIVVGLAHHTAVIVRSRDERAIVDSAVPLYDDEEKLAGVAIVLRDRTESHDVVLARNATQESLRSSEARYSAFFESTSDAMLMIDVDTKTIRYANPAACRMFGYLETELCGMALTDIHPRDSWSHVVTRFCSAAAGAQHPAPDIPCVKKDGTIVYMDITGTPLTIDGRTTLVGVFRDVTERRQAQCTLSASESRYRRLFESAKDGILILDGTTGRIVDVNPFLLELTGYSRAEFLGQHLWEIGAFKNVNAAKVAFAELLAKKYVRYEHLPLEARDGRTIAVEVVSNVYRVEDEKVIQCNVRDITERRRIEGELRVLERAVRAVSQGILITDAFAPDHPIIYASPGFERLSGYSAADVMGRNCRLLQGADTDPASLSSLRSAIREGRDCAVDLLNYRKDGTTFWNHLALSPVRDAEGHVVNFVGVQTDVTERRLLESQFRQAQKMEAVGRLAGGVAHDFNNLLSVILSYGDMLLADMKPGEPMRDDIEEIHKAGKRATDLTRQLLMFSRQQVLAPKVLDLNDVLTSMDKMLQRILGADVDLVSLPTQPLGRVRADPSGIEQVIMNLVVNARDAMPTGGKLTMETANVVLDQAYAAAHLGVKPGPHVMLAVTDTGIGIDQATLARIFEPFFTTKVSGKGTGLGLSTVFGVVQQSGGSVWVYSEVGRGTTFKVYLPRVDAAVEQVGVTVPPTTLRGSETILLVEDDDQVRVVARGILRRSGYHVIEARNAGEALLHSEQNPTTIHLLLSDVVMPQMSGPELAKRLTSVRPHMKVLCMSGYTDDSIVRHGVLEAHIAYLQKPITPETLTTRVREVLDGPFTQGVQA
jgi:PAS domain S-box-containing protein